MTLKDSFAIAGVVFAILGAICTIATSSYAVPLVMFVLGIVCMAHSQYFST